jgi:hypothetical protein
MIHDGMTEMNVELVVLRHNYKKSPVERAQVMQVRIIQTLPNLVLLVEEEVDKSRQIEIEANICLEG